MSGSWVMFRGPLIVYRPVCSLVRGESFFRLQCQADIRGLVTA